MQGVFSSVGQALHVSFLMEILPVTQQSSTQRMLDWLKREAGIRPDERDESACTLDFRGLQPHEIRGQCAMVRGTVEHHLPGPERDVVLARYGHQTAKARGVAGVADYVRNLTRVEHELALKALTWSVFHPAARAQDRWSLRAIAEETGVSKDQLHRASKVVKAQAQALREMAERRLLPLFERTGLVVASDSQAVAA